MNINVALCCLCQSGCASDALINPQNTGCVNQGTKDQLADFEKSVKKWTENECWPNGIINHEYWSDGNSGSIKDWFIKNNAVYHKNCRIKFSSSKLELAKKSNAKKRKQEAETNISPVKKTRALDGSFNSSFTAPKDDVENPCLFCGTEVNLDDESKREASTDTITATITKWATQLKDSELLAKLIVQGYDLHAGDAVYHKQCHTNMFTRYRASLRAELKPMVTVDPIKQAFCTVIDHMKENRDCSVFELDDMFSLFTNEVTTDMNRTRFKEKLLKEAPEFTEISTSSRRVLLFYKNKLGDTVHEITNDNSKQEIYAQVTKDLRKHLLQPQEPFSGTFSPECEDDAVDPVLVNFFKQLLQGKVLPDSKDTHCHRAALTLAQITALHCRSKPTMAATARHDKCKETPLAVYIALKLYQTTRSKKLINEFYKLGLSISYDRVLEILKDIEFTAIQVYEEEKVVFPLTLPRGVFISCNDDNLDSTPSDFHGTAISVNAHPTQEAPGQKVPFPQLQKATGELKLPEDFTVVKPAYLVAKKPTLPKTTNGAPLQPNITSVFKRAEEKEQMWLKATESIFKDETDPTVICGWAAFHAQAIEEPVIPIESSVLNVWPDKAHTPSMQKHSMETTISVTNKLNPGQTPILTVDEPLFALCKQLQLQHPETLGEDKIFIMLGQLHIEMCIQSMLAMLLESSGWSAALTAAGIASPGRAESLARGSHDVNLAGYAHEVTCATLHNLMVDAYTEEMAGKEFLMQTIPLEQWKANCEEEHPVFFYWSLILKLEIIYRIFMRSLREANFDLYKEALAMWVKWTHALDRTNYRRWLPIHLRDLAQLETRHPDLYKAFVQGFFVASRTSARFSNMGLDQVTAH